MAMRNIQVFEGSKTFNGIVAGATVGIQPVAGTIWRLLMVWGESNTGLNGYIRILRPDGSVRTYIRTTAAWTPDTIFPASAEYTEGNVAVTFQPIGYELFVEANETLDIYIGGTVAGNYGKIHALVEVFPLKIGATRVL